MKNSKETLDILNLTRLSHDIQAPVSSILGIINLAKKEVIDKEVLKYFQMIEECSNVLNANIQGTLKAISSENYNPKTDFVDFDLLIEVVVHSLTKMKDFEKMNFQLRIDNKIPFYSDLPFLTSIFQNLIENGIKYRDQNKEKSKLNIWVADNGDYIRIIISDDGVGIKKSDQRKVFMKSYRASSEVHGNGFGLYLVQKTIEILNGKIRLDSKLGLGTVFTILIPNRKLTVNEY